MSRPAPLSEPLLRTLADHPDGLLWADLLRLMGSPDRDRGESALRAMLRQGYVQRVEPARRRRIVWQITESGRERLAKGRFRAPRGSFTHGTAAGYLHYDCRCEPCRAWASATLRWHAARTCPSRRSLPRSAARSGR